MPQRQIYCYLCSEKNGIVLFIFTLVSILMISYILTVFLGKTTVTVSNPTLTTLHAEWVPAGGDLLTGYSVKVVKISTIPGQKSKV